VGAVGIGSWVVGVGGRGGITMKYPRRVSTVIAGGKFGSNSVTAGVVLPAKMNSFRWWY
jgi:hypothetical protein